jgi:hypothetical protein
MLKEHFLRFKRHVFPQLFSKTSQNSPQNNLCLKVIEALDLAAWILLGKPWKYLWVMIRPIPVKSISLSTIQHIGDTNLWNHHSFHRALFFFLENFHYLAELFFLNAKKWVCFGFSACQIWKLSENFTGFYIRFQ